MTMQTDDMDKLLYEKIGACRDRWLESQPEQCESHHFSETFLVGLSEIGKHSRSPWRILRIVAAVAALLAALTLTIGAELIPPVRAFRSGVVHVLSQVLPKSTDQIYTTDADHEGETKRPVLGWMPEGMVETKRDEQPEYTHMRFEGENKTLVLYIRRITNNASVSASFDTEDAQVTEIFINENFGTLAVEQDRIRLIFFVDNYRCSLSGTLTADEAVKIAENIILK